MPLTTNPLQVTVTTECNVYDDEETAEIMRITRSSGESSHRDLEAGTHPAIN